MGMNTTVFILNDRLGELQDNPKAFVDSLHAAINASCVGRELIHVPGQTKVMPTAHADVPRLYFSRGNAMSDLSYSWNAKEAVSGRNKEEQLSHLKVYKDRLKSARYLLREYAKDLKKVEAEILASNVQ